MVFHSPGLWDRSPIVVPDDRPASGQAGPGARPGGRLPHVWLGPGRSVYDRLGSGMTLMVLHHDRDTGSWVGLVQAAQASGVPLDVLDLRGRDLRDRYGAALVLVRPDQHVAWRADAPPADPGAVLNRARGVSPRPASPPFPERNDLPARTLTGRSDI